MYAPPICSSPKDGRTDPFSLSSRNLFILGDFNCHHPLRDSRGTSDPRMEEVFDWVIFSDLLPLNDLDTPTLLHRSSGSRSSPDIFFAPSSLALSCSWEVPQDLVSDHLPILLSIPLSAVFCLNERPPSINFQKARWDDFDFHYASAEEYSSLSLSSAAALFTLTIWPFGPPPPRSPLRWKPHKELCFYWSTGVFLSIRANVRLPCSQRIPTKLTSSLTSSYSVPTSVSFPLQLFLGSPSTALFPFLNMHLC